MSVSAEATDEQSRVTAIYVRFEKGTSASRPVSLAAHARSGAPTNDVGTSNEPFVRLVRNGDVWSGSLTIPGCVRSGSWKVATLTVYPGAPSAARYDNPLSIDDIACSDNSGPVACDGSAGGVTTAVLDVPAIASTASYEIWANLHQAIPQIVDAQGYALDPEYGPQSTAGPVNADSDTFTSTALAWTNCCRMS